MNRNDYLQLRKQNRIQEIAFVYYKEKGGTYDFQTISKSNIFVFLNFDSLIDELDLRFSVTSTFFNGKLINIE